MLSSATDLGHRVAIVGCGIIGRTHADTVAAHPEASVVALVDSIPPGRAALAARLAAAGHPEPRQYDDLTSALAAGDVDLVAICTPSGTHAALAEEALAEKKHVVVEKPLDVDLPRARKLGAAAAAAATGGLVSSVISQHRFDPGSVLVARTIAEGGFGALTSAVATVAWWRSDEYYGSAAWRGTWALDGGGALMNQGVHTVDLLLWFLGRPVTVQAQVARTTHHGIEVEDTAVATLTFGNGAVATLHATTAAFGAGGTRISVHGTEGGAEIENDRLRTFHHHGSTETDVPALTEPSGHEAQYADIFRAIATGEQPGVTIQHALEALATVRAVYIASTLQRPVHLDEVLDGVYDDLPIQV